MSYKKHGLLSLREDLGSPLVFGGARVTHLLSFLCCVFCFARHRPASCVGNVASVSGVSILLFSLTFICQCFVPCKQPLKIEIEQCSNHRKYSKVITIIYEYQYA